MKLHELKPADGSRKKPKRVGRGPGSGHGKTATRGSKGQKARSGGSVRRGFEGGQMPIHRRLPKRGFTNIFKSRIAIVNLRDLRRFPAGTCIDEPALRASGLIKGQWDSIKLLGQGEIDTALTIKLPQISSQARQKIEASGGKIEVI